LARVEIHLSISRMRDQINEANQKLLAWNIELSQRGHSSTPASTGAIPEGLAGLFGKPPSALQAGDRVDAALSILAAASPSDETLDTIENSLRVNHDGFVSLDSAACSSASLLPRTSPLRKRSSSPSIPPT